MGNSVRYFGVDTGGTFTDVVCVGPNGPSVHKLLSTPDNPSRAIVQGMSVLGADESSQLVHGTTVATNALLERAGARVGFITTVGFGDMLYIGRQNRPDLYALRVQTPNPLPSDTFELVERLDSGGNVVVAPTPAELERLRLWASESGCTAFAICLLHAYANPAHERMVARALEEAVPAAHISCSHEVLNAFREYERASTTSVNAFVGPVMSNYLRSLAESSPAAGIEIMQSNGGRCDLAFASRFPVQTVLSGPAGGVVGAMNAAQSAGMSRIITFDMGGTSTDVSLVDGQPTWTSEATVDGLPVGVPVIDIYTVGAGGGSIARQDRGGALRVGPESAGASPGPAAYGRGGDQPTVTDAHVVLGRIPPDRFLGGEMNLDVEAARAVVGKLAGELGESMEAVASGMLEIAEASMARAIKVISIERGHDPREFTLVSFGGAGGLHACSLAESLEIPTVLIPMAPGLLSAIGALASESVRVKSQAVLEQFDDWDADTTIAELAAEMAEFEGYALRFEVDLRYLGQSFEIAVPWSDDVVGEFGEAHERLYGYRSERPIEVVAMRAVANRPSPAPPIVWTPAEGGPTNTQNVWFGDWVEAVVVERSSITGSLVGPAIITEYSGTTVIPPGWTVSVVAGGHLEVRR